MAYASFRQYACVNRQLLFDSEINFKKKTIYTKQDSNSDLQVVIL